MGPGYVCEAAYGDAARFRDPLPTAEGIAFFDR